MKFDFFSFLLGTIAGFFIWWVNSSIRKSTPRIKSFIADWSKSHRSRTGAAIESKIRQNTFQLAQKAHLANNLFPLDDILIAPKIIPSPKSILNQQNHPPYSPTDRLVSFTPDFPELASLLPTSKISILESISNHAHCVLIAPPGSGKSVALAHLASHLCDNQDPEKWFAKIIPFYLNAHDFCSMELHNRTPLEIITGILGNLNPLIQNNLLSSWVKKSLEEQHCLIILDGLDELPPEKHSSFSPLINDLVSTYPECQILTTASPDYLGFLPELGFAPLCLSCWNQNEIDNFIALWKKSWLKLFEKSKDITDFTAAWLLRESEQLTPLEWTLKVWASFSGDLHGTSPLHAIEAYIFRSTGKTIPRSAIANLAREHISARQTGLSYVQTEKVFSVFKPQTQTADRMDFLEQHDVEPSLKSNKQKKERKIVSRAKAITQLIDTGLLVEYQNEYLAFPNPVVSGYLASFAKDIEQSLPQKINWIGESQTVRYLSAQNKSMEYLTNLIETDDSPLFVHLLYAARSLNTPRHDEPWRNSILEKIGLLLTQANLPRPILLKLVSGLLASNDPSISALFNQLLKSRKPEARFAALLAVAAQRTDKFIQAAVNMLQDEDEDVRLAAALYLGMVDHPIAKQAINEIIVNGEEDQRLITAEALSIREQNKDVLSEYLEHEDLLTRRAAIGAFAKTDHAIALPVLERLMREDSQWVIRNYAAQWVEAYQGRMNPYAPERIPAFSESDWLISYAGKMGLGISPEILPYEVLLHAVQNGETDERIAAMDYLTGVHSTEKDNLYDSIINNRDETIRDEAVFYRWYQNLEG